MAWKLIFDKVKDIRITNNIIGIDNAHVQELKMYKIREQIMFSFNDPAYHHQLTKTSNIITTSLTL